MDVLPRVVEDLLARVSGPLHFRLLMQPAMAALFGLRDGWKDAEGGRPPYFWAIFYRKNERAELLRGGLRSVAKILLLAILLDTIYQFIELRWFYPGEAILVAFVLAFVPYVLIRGPVNRIARAWISRQHTPRYGLSK